MMESEAIAAIAGGPAFMAGRAEGPAKPARTAFPPWSALARLKEERMTDLLIRAIRGEFVTIHVRSPRFDPPPGEEADGLAIYRVEDVPEGLAMGDAIDIFRDLGRTRFVWPWEDFVRRAPVGRTLAAAEAGERIGLSAFTIKKLCRERELPASRAPDAPNTGGIGIHYMVDENDLAWWAANKRRSVGRPKKARTED